MEVINPHDSLHARHHRVPIGESQLVYGILAFSILRADTGYKRPIFLEQEREWLIVRII
ncbi:hypothetical protein M1M86_00465 [Dehalococcoidales bacterium]|nr:hypothetical protein [Dehalococcoidales bacterium]